MQAKNRLMVGAFVAFAMGVVHAASQGAAQAPDPQGGPAVAPAQGGRGAGGGGRGGGLGGPGKDDPINAGVDYSKKPPLLPKRPDEQLKQFILQPGYRLELVLADPDIQEPSAISFDGNGRMFVLEDRGYMQDADARGQLDPIGRVSLHTDTDNDGVYDKHTVFADHLVFPRFLTPFGPNTLLTKESNADEVWKYTDTNGDGVADTRELWGTGFGRLGNVEHQESHFTWALDNWMYSTFNAFRTRWTPHGVIKEPTGAGGGQWGVTQDDDGKVWFQGGASGVPAYWQFPIVYGNFSVPDQMDPDMRIPWGAPIRIADMQGGMAVIRMPDGSLRSTTAGAGNEIFRGDRLPKDLSGDYFYGEEVARIVRRIRPETREGLTYLRNAVPNNEFIKSLDPYFRPVDMATAPDGTLYISDLYHGIIQESTWSRPGTYLRAKIEQFDLDKVIHHGRVWRLVFDGVKPDNSDAIARDRTMPRMNNETAAQLVRHLSHPNGWWRDTAQQLLVLKQDKSVVPALQALARTSPNLLARFHAMWTLEGLDALDAALVRQGFKDAEPRMRIQAIRASETLYKGGDKSFAADYKALSNDSNVDVAIQAMLTMNKWQTADAAATIKATADRNKARGVQVVAQTILNPGAANAGRGGGGPGRGAAPALTTEQQTAMARGGAIYRELCFSCHGDDGRGTPREGSAVGVTMAPPLAGSPRVNGHRDYVVNALLHGLTGPIDGERYVEVMIPMGENQNQWVADIASYVRNTFGNSASFVSASDVARVRAGASGRTAPWTVDDLQATLPAVLAPDPAWKLSASHNTAAARTALSFTSWSSLAPQEPGMWLQVELPEAVTLTEVQFTSTAGGGGRGGGGGGAARGRGAAPGGAAPEIADALPPTPPAPGPVVPRTYQVQVSADGTTWSAPLAEGQGVGTVALTFTPTRARFVRVTQTALAPNAPAWTVQNLKLYRAGGATGGPR